MFSLSRHTITNLLAIALATVLLCSVSFLPSWRAVFSPAGIETQAYSDGLNDFGQSLKASGAVMEGAAEFTENGLALQPGSSFRITWKFPVKPGELPFARVLASSSDVADIRILFRVGGEVEEIRVPRSDNTQLFEPRKLHSAGQQYEVTIHASLPPVLQERQLLIDLVEIGSVIRPAGRFQPEFWALFPACGITLGAFAIARRRHCSPSRALLLAACSGALLAVAGVFAGPGLFPAIASLVLGLGLLLPLLPRSQRAAPSRFEESLTVLSLIGLALAIRWQWFIVLLPFPIQPDCVNYFEITRDLTWPYGTGFREPFTIWSLWLWFHATAIGPHTLHLHSMLWDLVLCATLYLLARQFLSPRLSWFVGLLYALNPLAAYSSVLGLREEIFPVMITLYLLGVVRALRHPANASNYYLMAAAATAGTLVRWNAISFIVPLLGAVAIANRRHWKLLLPVVASLVVFVTPMLVYHKVRFGDPFYINTANVKSMANLKFAGTPGFPTKAEVDKNILAGDYKITTGEFLFKYHSPEVLVSGFARGWWSMLFGQIAMRDMLRIGWTPRVDAFGHPQGSAATQTLLDWILYSFYVIGFLACIKLRHAWVIPASILLFQLPLGFLVGCDLIGARHSQNPLVLMLLLAGVGVWNISHDLIQWQRAIAEKLRKPNKAHPPTPLANSPSHEG